MSPLPSACCSWLRWLRGDLLLQLLLLLLLLLRRLLLLRGLLLQGSLPRLCLLLGLVLLQLRDILLLQSRLHRIATISDLHGQSCHLVRVDLRI